MIGDLLPIACTFLFSGSKSIESAKLINFVEPDSIADENLASYSVRVA